jgi:CTP synthase (UTP-ammonia lyase)
MTRLPVGLVGDFDETKVAHRAIQACFRLAQDSDLAVEPLWLGTDRLKPGDEAVFRGVAGIWCVPGSPYVNVLGALWAIEYARTRGLPFLGTCGGLQHALLEYARNVLGLKEMAHAEDEPGAAFPLLHRMQCSLVEKSQTVLVAPGTRFRELYGSDSGQEGFHCSYGLNPRFEHLFRNGPLEFVARSEDGEVRAVELRGHPFFIGTLFQPERRALEGSLHPLVRAFFGSFRSCQG